MIILLGFLIFSPSIWITSSININLFDMFPLMFVIYIVIYKIKKIKLLKHEMFIIKILMFLGIFLLISTFVSFIYFEGETINTFLQLYRRLISILLIPLFIFSYKNVDLLKVFFYLSLIVLFIGILGELVNFIEPLREILFYKFVSVRQIVVPGFWRNMGFTGEGSYFASLLIIVIFINIFFPIKFRNFFIFSLTTIMLLTFSKSVLLSFMITIIIYFIYTKRTHYLMIYFLIAGSSLFLLIWYFNIFDVIELYFTSRAESSFSERTNGIWIKVINFITNHEYIVFSTGLGFKGLKYYADVAGAHNQYLSLLSNFGIFGLVYMWVFFIFIPYIVYKVSKNKIYIFLAILFGIQSFVHEPLVHSQVVALYLFIFSLIIKYYGGLKNEKSISSRLV